MNTVQEMIEVLQAYERGEQIEWRAIRGTKDWCTTLDPIWAFTRFEFRIAKPAPKCVKFECWTDGSELWWSSCDEEYYKAARYQRVPNLDLVGAVEP